MVGNGQETQTLIDLWSKYPCLWDIRDAKYKNTDAKQAAFLEIIDAMGLDWTIGKLNTKLPKILVWQSGRIT